MITNSKVIKLIVSLIGFSGVIFSGVILVKSNTFLGFVGYIILANVSYNLIRWAERNMNRIKRNTTWKVPVSENDKKVISKIFDIFNSSGYSLTMDNTDITIDGDHIVIKGSSNLRDKFSEFNKSISEFLEKSKEELNKPLRKIKVDPKVFKKLKIKWDVLPEKTRKQSSKRIKKLIKEWKKPIKKTKPIK